MSLVHHGDRSCLQLVDNVCGPGRGLVTACLHDLVLLRCPARLLIRWEKAEGSGPKR